MIRKSHCLILVLFLCSSLVLGKSEVDYYRIIQKYNMNLHSFEAGHPISYDWNKEQTKAIIFLTNEIDHLEILNECIFVGNPTLKNANSIVESLPITQIPAVLLLNCRYYNSIV